MREKKATGGFFSLIISLLFEFDIFFLTHYRQTSNLQKFKFPQSFGKYRKSLFGTTLVFKLL